MILERIIPYIDITTINCLFIHTVKDSNLDMMILLLERGANIDAEDTTGFTSIFFAKTVDVLKLLIDNNANTEHITDEGMYPLFYYIINDNINLITYMLDDGYNIDKINNIVNSVDKSALMLTIKLNNKNIAKLLLKHGANINAENKDGLTSIFFAKTEDVLKLLIDNRANVEHTSYDGTYPLYYF